MITSNRLVVDGPVVRSSAFVPILGDAAAEAWSAARTAPAQPGFAAPAATSWDRTTRCYTDPTGALVPVGDDSSTFAETVDGIVAAAFARRRVCLSRRFP